jgi:hypothetical protein
VFWPCSGISFQAVCWVLVLFCFFVIALYSLWRVLTRLAAPRIWNAWWFRSLWLSTPCPSFSFHVCPVGDQSVPHQENIVNSRKGEWELRSNKDFREDNEDFRGGDNEDFRRVFSKLLGTTYLIVQWPLDVILKKPSIQRLRVHNVINNFHL